MGNFFKTNNLVDCCGCSACERICPHHCIRFKSNDEGFLYPIKDLDVCVECGLCERVCPLSEGYSFESFSTPDVYAAYDNHNREGSTSGGVFFTLAEYIIKEKKGWVFGAAFNDTFLLEHRGVNNMEDLESLRGSKYLQSSMGENFTTIKKLLNDGQAVLFAGTPCQIAGLRSFLRRKYDGLLLVDVVCHGVPSQSLFNKHVEYLNHKHKAKLVNYQFRNNDGWGYCETALFTQPRKMRKLPSFELSPYLYSFMHAMTFRESCYDCKFAKVPRQGDISLADFWGVRHFFPNLDVSKGVSLVLLNSETGRCYFNEIKHKLITEQSNLHDASRFNNNLINKTPRPGIRDYIYKEIGKYGYEYVAKTRFRVKHYNFVFLRTYLLGNRLVQKLLSTTKSILKK